MACLWGVSFYFIMARMFMKSEENANKQLKDAENESSDDNV